MRRSSLACLVLLLALPSCGGGGGGAPPDPVPLALEGRYSFAALGARSVGASTVFAQAGQLTSDGQSQVSLVASFVNADGTVVPALPATATFTVDPEGILTLTAAGGAELRGQISDDGALLALSSSTAGTPPGVFLAVRTGGAFGLGSLSGTYFVGTVRATQAPELQARFVPVTFDGTGGAPALGSGLRNTNGSVFITSAGADTGTYAVFADGSVAYTGALGTYFGGLLEGGDVGFLAGSDAGQPALMVLVRQGTAMTASALDGLYGTARFFFTGATEINYASLAGPSTADGLGGLASTDLLANREGALGAGFTRSASYAVQVNGRLDLTHVAGGSAEILSGTGAVEPQGRFAFCVGNGNPGDPPALEVLVRRGGP